MSAYLIAQIDVNDWESFRKYQRGLIESLTGMGGRVIADGKATHLEGAEPSDLNVIIEFESEAKARQWYESEAYQKIVPIRQASAPGARMMILQAL
jgi:uncharacterized protein (DUF1330 family)